MPEVDVFDGGWKITPPDGKYLYIKNLRPFEDDDSATANKKFINWVVRSTATSGDARAEYLRLYITGAGGGGEALRAFTTVNDVAGGSAHGVHASLNFGTSGTITGQGIAGRNTLHLPNTALASNVTLAAVQAEIWSDGSASDPGGSTILSFFRAVAGGHANGIADVQDDAVLFDLQGITSGAGHLFVATAPSTLGASLKIRVGSTLYYIPLYTTTGST